MGDETKVDIDDESKALNNIVHDESKTSVNAADLYNDDSYAQIVNDKKSDATSVDQDSVEFVCLKKDDLLKYARDPFWVRVRIGLMVVFGVTWVSMLVAAIIIIVVAPKCPAQPHLDWWQKAVIYHIHPQSFMDSNGDGFGDIKGILKNIDYLKDTLDVTAVTIGPMNPTPNFNYGYNIVNYNVTCPHHYGTMSDLNELDLALHKRGMKLLLDFIPNHTSRNHTWFVASSQPGNKQHSVYKDYYVWHKGRDNATGSKLPPNNWLNVYGGSAWTFDENRQEFYYHAFSADEPDLNLRNEAVVAELDSSMRLWLSRGIDGFRMYGAQYLVESTQVLEDEPTSTSSAQFLNDYKSLIHDHTTFQRGSYDLIEHWRQVLDDFSNNDGKARSRYYPRLLIADVDGDVNQTIAFVSEVVNGTRHERAHIATNKQLVEIDGNCKTDCIYGLLTAWQQQADVKNVWSNWQLGNVDSRRIATRVNEQLYTSAFNLLLLTLPGTAVVYYGDELGMQDITLDSSLCTANNVVEDKCRLVNRAPMQWSDEKFAGFSAGNKTWIPVNSDYHSINVQAQLAHGAGASPLSVFRNVSGLRHEPSFQWGQLHVATQGNVLFYIRRAEGFDSYLVAVNFGPEPSTVNLAALNKDELALLPTVGSLVATTGHFEGPGRGDQFKLGTPVKLSSVHMKPGEGIVVLLPVSEDHA